MRTIPVVASSNHTLCGGIFDLGQEFSCPVLSTESSVDVCDIKGCTGEVDGGNEAPTSDSSRS